MIVIGSGAGGGTLVHRLAPSGKRILLLERGDWLPREPQNWRAQDVFVDNRYVSPDTWYDADGKPFQPQVHYFVGGATKLYGAALYRLREKDFGELRHHDGISPAWPIGYDELEPYYTQAEQLYQVHGARGEDPTEPSGERALSLPGGLPRAAHPAALRRPRGRRLPPLPRPLRDHARRGQHALQPLRPLRDLRRVSVSGARQVGRRGARGAAGAGALQRHAAHQRAGASSSRPTTRAPRSPRSWSSARARREVRGRRRGRLVRGRQLGQAPAQLSASDKHPNGLANGSDQVGRNFMFHDSTAVLALSHGGEPDVFQKTLGLNDFYFASDDFDYPLGNIQMVGKSQAPMFRGEKPVETEAGAPSGRWSEIAQPRGRLLALHRGPAAARTTARPSDRDGKLTLSYTETNARCRRSSCTTSSSRCSDTSGMHPTTCSPRTRT